MRVFSKRAGPVHQKWQSKKKVHKQSIRQWTKKFTGGSMLNGFRRIGQSNFVLVTFISMHNLWKCSIPSTMSRVKCMCFLFLFFFFIRAKGELNRPVNVMSISQTFFQGLSPSHLLQGHGNSREIPDTTLSIGSLRYGDYGLRTIAGRVLSFVRSTGLSRANIER